MAQPVSNQLAQELVALARQLQPSIASQGSNVVINHNGREIQIPKYRSSAISQQNVRFR